LLAYILKGNLELASYVFLNASRNANAARLSYPFQTYRYVHSIAENVAVLDDDIANIDANAELDPPLPRQVGVAFSHAALHIKRAAHGVHHAAELSQDSVAGILNNASAVFANLGIDKGAQMFFQLNVRALLVDAGQPTVANDIGGQDSGEPSL
jgi:hypothetical protein